MIINDNEYIHFKRKEFKCKCGDCKRSHVDPDYIDEELVKILTDIREHFNRPVIITSGTRCIDHNKSVGGTRASQHLLGKAADFKVAGIHEDEVVKYLFKKYPQQHGIGRYHGRTHIDVRGYKARWDFRS